MIVRAAHGKLAVTMRTNDYPPEHDDVLVGCTWIASSSALAEIARNGGQEGLVDLGWRYGKLSGRQLYFFSVRYYLSGTQITKKNE